MCSSVIMMIGKEVKKRLRKSHGKDGQSTEVKPTAGMITGIHSLRFPPLTHPTNLDIELVLDELLCSQGTMLCSSGIFMGADS